MATPQRRFTWRCWHNGQLQEVVISPMTREEKHAQRGGLPGRIYQRDGQSLRSISGTVHQDGDGRVYFVET